ncbi:MAG: hypothetical protein KJP25_12205 [Gammaproteobacteria bacterium]|nr:hypothetical protein [Gammaproteobacteria bacterium]MBT8150285.1 hypothetical protein [Gammaproteobacteria bacterium]NND38265.1 hypothetical protein [Pseudomonadales bacterium]NNM11106.1 hypothetical protein [Pseudomonadales bacterium]
MSVERRSINASTLFGAVCGSVFGTVCGTVFGTTAGALLLVASSTALAQNAGANDGRRPVEVFPLKAASVSSRRQVDQHRLTQAFWVDASVSELNLSCEVSDMEIERDQDSKLETTELLGADEAAGCRIEVPGAVTTLGANHLRVATFKQRNGSGEAGTLSTDYVTFRTADGTEFKREVLLSLVWHHTKRLQRSGRYKGAVKLVATVPQEFEAPK